ncbi:MAG: PD40 domain-containing protein [Bacteroidetes bacterium]|nr:PD40 domain-containing protein [Bacteroidota bacterium]
MKTYFTMKRFDLIVVCAGLLLAILTQSHIKRNKINIPDPAPYEHQEALHDPIVFAKDIITTKDDEFGGTFTPDGKTCFFSKSVLRFYIDVICYSEFKNGKWQTPQVAPFSGRYRDFDPTISADGTKMIFTSDRPVSGEDEIDYNIWMVTKTASGWSEPVMLDSGVNSKYDEHFASMAANGTIYFSSNRPGALGGDGDADIYRCVPVNGKYLTAEHLDSASSPAYELDCTIAPDESFLLIGDYGRQGGSGSFDIFISKNINGKWSEAKNIGPKVNTRFRDYSPRISPDKKYLFFTSEKDFAAPPWKGVSSYKELEENFRGIFNGAGNIYQVELEALGIQRPR